jgi:hypothetical protein
MADVDQILRTTFDSAFATEAACRTI